MTDEVLTLAEARVLMSFWGCEIIANEDGTRATMYFTRDGKPMGWYLPVYRIGAIPEIAWPWTHTEWIELAAMVENGRAGWPATEDRAAFCLTAAARLLREF